MSKTYPDFEGSVAVVTGAGGILCSEFSKTIAQTKAKVALLDVNYDAVKQVADEISAQGGIALAIQCDVLNPESLKTAHQNILEKFGACNILLNGAGGNNKRATTTSEHYVCDGTNEVSFFDLKKEGIEFVFGLNFMGTLLPVQEFARDMLTGKGNNTIINISSMNAFRPLTKIPAYSAAKAAISNFTQWLAVYLADKEIRVNALAPGFFSTKQTRPLFYKPDGTHTERYKKIISHTPMHRLGVPQDLDGTLLWLLDPDASGFVTGVVVPIDGGFSAYSGV